MEELLVKYWPQLGMLLTLVGGIATLKADTKSTRLNLQAHAEVTRIAFDGVNHRLDKVNGRLDRTEDRQQEHGERIAKLEP